LLPPRLARLIAADAIDYRCCISGDHAAQAAALIAARRRVMADAI